MGMTRIGIVAVCWLLVGIVVLLAVGAGALIIGASDYGLGQRFLMTAYALVVVMAVPAVAALTLLDRLAQRARLIDGDLLDLVVWRWIHHRCPSDPAWESIPKHEGMPYRTYLDSDAWRDRRRHLLRRVGYRCQVCNGSGRLDVHHRTYVRLGHEHPEDLTVLCRTCHRLFHGAGYIEERTL